MTEHHQSEYSTTAYPCGCASSSSSSSASSPSRPMAYHRRSGTLKLSSKNAEIAAQRSHSLYRSVSNGEISLDAVLAFPIDWQGIAVEVQWSRSRREIEEEEEIPTMNPLAVKYRTKSNRTQESYPSPPSSSTTETQEIQDHSTLGLDLLLDVDSTSSYSFFPSSSTVTTEEDIPTSPTLSSTPVPELDFSSSAANSPCSSSDDSSDYSVSTPSFSTLQLQQADDAKFDLKSYCSIFNDADREWESWRNSSRQQTEII